MSDLFERPKIATEPLSLVLLASDSEQEITELTRQWSSVLEENGKEFEIIVVGDFGAGSVDDAVFAGHPTIKLIDAPEAKDFGAALQLGIAEARFPLVAYCTADGQYVPSDLKRLVEKIDQVDVVATYRNWRKPPLWFRGLELVYRGIMRVVFGISREPLPCWLGWQGFGRRQLGYWIFNILLHDPESAFRLARRELFARIPIQSAGTFGHYEIAAKANFLGALLDEIPVDYQPLTGDDRAQAKSLQEATWRDIGAVFNRPNFGPVRVETHGLTCLPSTQIKSSVDQIPNADTPTSDCDDPPGANDSDNLSAEL